MSSKVRIEFLIPIPPKKGEKVSPGDLGVVGWAQASETHPGMPEVELEAVMFQGTNILPILESDNEITSLKLAIRHHSVSYAAKLFDPAYQAEQQRRSAELEEEIYGPYNSFSL